MNLPTAMCFQHKITVLFGIILYAFCWPLHAQNASPYTLQQAIDYALENNPDLQIMQDRIGQAKAQLEEVQSSFFPQIKTRLSYEHTDNPSRAFGMIISQRRFSFSGTNFNHPGGTDNYRPEVTASYSLFRGGQDYFMSKAAESEVKAATFDQSAMHNQLIQMVSSAFYSYLAAVEAHHVTLRSIAAVSSELKQSRIRYRAGSTLKSDVLSLEVQLAEAQDNEIRAANTIELARVSLKTLLGLDSEEPFEIETAGNWKTPDPQNEYSALLTRALAQRPEIKAANQRLTEAERRLSAAKGAHLPRADAYLSYGSDSKNLDFSTSRDNITTGVQIEMDIFSGFRDSARIKKAEHQLSTAEKNMKRIRLQIENEVKSGFLKLKASLDRLKVTTASVVAAEEALRMVKAQRRAGTVTVTRYIEVEVARDEAHSRSIAARFDALRAEAQLHQAIGFWN